MPTNFKIAQDAEFSIGEMGAAGAMPTTWTILEDADGFTPPKPETARQEISSFKSGRKRKYVNGMRDMGELTVTMWIDAGSTIDDKLEEFYTNDAQVCLKAEIPNSTATPLTINYVGQIKT